MTFECPSLSSPPPESLAESVPPSCPALLQLVSTLSYDTQIFVFIHERTDCRATEQNFEINNMITSLSDVIYYSFSIYFYFINNSPLQLLSVHCAKEKKSFRNYQGYFYSSYPFNEGMKISDTKAHKCRPLQLFTLVQDLNLAQFTCFDKRFHHP